MHELTFYHNDDVITDWNDLTQKMHSEEVKTISISVQAPKSRTVENFKITHGKGVKVTHDDIIPAGKKIDVIIEIDAKIMWQDNLPRLDLEFTYDLVLDSKSEEQ